jgi:ribulose-5-phosphate 4-epimerase/fuculose-1-phosphate aldolase
LREEEKQRLQNNLGNNNNLILRNHGLLTVGPSIPDAFLMMYNLQNACTIQIKAQAGGALINVNPAILAGVKANVAAVTKGAGGKLAWPSILRKLDRINPGYQQ